MSLNEEGGKGVMSETDHSADGNESANDRMSACSSLPRGSSAHNEYDDDVDDQKLKELGLSLRNDDWETLQHRFTEAMEERTQEEMVLQRETADLLEMFISWSQTTALRDEDRAYKRFKTRMGFVQNSEMQLEERKQHCESNYLQPLLLPLLIVMLDANVVKAFESALALLRDE
ncbi:hypothetical protein KEM54_003711 [Ascosphaera aggregata]|nr:hypothetical protein KEM54_003711 [Ascosphaera aggregata]